VRAEWHFFTKKNKAVISMREMLAPLFHLTATFNEGEGGKKYQAENLHGGQDEGEAIVEGPGFDIDPFAWIIRDSPWLLPTQQQRRQRRRYYSCSIIDGITHNN